MSHQNDSLLIAWLVSIFYSVTYGIVGTTDLEEQYNGAFSYAASFKSEIFARAPVFGKHTYLGIPVYDTSVGLGYRLPFLYGTSHSPLVFLRYLLTTEGIQLFVVTFALFIALLNFNLMFKSWISEGSRFFLSAIQLLLNVSLLGPPTLYLFVNEWSTQAAQYFGAISILSALLDRAWFEETVSKPLSQRRIHLGLAIGMVLLFNGHAGNIVNFVFIFTFPFAFHLYRKKISTKDLKVVIPLILIFCGSALPNVTDLILESSRQPFARITSINWYSFHASLVGLVSLIKSLIYGNVWPLDALFRYSQTNQVPETNKGYFGFVSIAMFVFMCKAISKNKSMRAVVVILILSYLGIVLQSSIQNQIGIFASSAAWQLRDPLLILSITMTTFLIIHLSDSKKLKSRGLKAAKAFIIFLTVISAMFPIAVILIQIKDSGSSNGIIPKSLNPDTDEWVEKLREAGVNDGSRLYIAHSDLFRFANWSGYEKLPQFVDLNVSTINGWPKIRSSFTLAKYQAGFEARFFNIIDARFGCRSEEIGFLAVEWVIDANGECMDSYLHEFGKDMVRIHNLGQNSSGSGATNVFLYQINQKKVYVHKGILTRSDGEPCALLVEENCLKKLELKSEIKDGKSFQLCYQSCIATFSWSETSTENQMVLPLDYQPFFKIVNVRTKEVLTSRPLNGLLMINPGINTQIGDSIKILMQPDEFMRISALSAWITSLSLIMLCACSAIKDPNLRKLTRQLSGKSHI